MNIENHKTICENLRLKMKVKVCGMRNPENIKDLVKLPIDFIGFIFYEKSPRYAGQELARDVIDSIPESIKKVGVFVDSPIEEILKIAKNNNLDFIQLHGNESLEYCKILKNEGLRTIKVFNLNESFDFQNTKDYIDVCDYFLFDTKTEQYGGSGQKFNWKKLNEFDISSKKYFLSGGISHEDNQLIKAINPKPFAIDLNSRFEIDKGLKNIELIKEFVLKVNK